MLLAYIFELTTAKTKIPTVIPLLIVGWIVRQVVNSVLPVIPDLTQQLNSIGMIGLILIVFEGALELDVNASKKGIIKRSILMAVLPMITLALVIATVLSFSFEGSFKTNFIAALPLCMISSAIAIPSVKNLKKEYREFVVYESTIGDIVGVLLFNFLIVNSEIGLLSIGMFFWQLLVTLVISFGSGACLALLLSRIEHRIKFVPLILAIIFIYSLTMVFHLPGLLFILLFGVFLGNVEQLKKVSWIDRFNPDVLKQEVSRLKELTIEATFFARSLFFLLFGFMIEINEVLNEQTFFWSAGIVLAIYFIRALSLMIAKIPLSPLVLVAPRGLINILLFLSIPAAYSGTIINRSMLVQIVVLTALGMATGLISARRESNR